MECFHEFHDLLKLVAGCYVLEFAVFKLLEQGIHGISASFHLG
jgi:hypothetical protein